MFAYTKKNLLIRKGQTHIMGKKLKMPQCKPAIATGGMYFTHGEKWKTRQDRLHKRDGLSYRISFENVLRK